MQSQPYHLIRQQIILKRLGYYTGPLDGIWGPDAIEAMRKYENRVEFYRPARPTCGLPFADGARLPAGLWFDRHGFVCSDEVPETPEKEELDARIAHDGLVARGPRRRKPKPGAVVPVEDSGDDSDDAEDDSVADDATAIEVKAQIVEDVQRPPQQQQKSHQQHKHTHTKR